MSSIKIVECPRDAMQGIKQWIPSEIKLDYLQSVLSVGFDVVDFGSFVSKRAIPQMSDSAYIIDQLDLSNTTSKLLAIVANERGALDACSHSSLSFLGFPFSISEIFQMRNTNKSINESFEELKKIKTISEKYSKNLVVYLSMGFGNPYGEPWNYEIVEKWIDKLSDLKIQVISLSDTIGTAVPDDIFRIFSNIIPDILKLNLELIFTLGLMIGLKKLIQLTELDVKDLMVQFKVLVVVLWQKMN